MNSPAEFTPATHKHVTSMVVFGPFIRTFPASKTPKPFIGLLQSLPSLCISLLDQPNRAHPSPSAPYSLPFPLRSHHPLELPHGRNHMPVYVYPRFSFQLRLRLYQQFCLHQQLRLHQQPRLLQQDLSLYFRMFLHSRFRLHQQGLSLQVSLRMHQDLPLHVRVILPFSLRMHQQVLSLQFRIRMQSDLPLHFRFLLSFSLY